MLMAPYESNADECCCTTTAQTRVPGQGEYKFFDPLTLVMGMTMTRAAQVSAQPGCFLVACLVERFLV